ATELQILANLGKIRVCDLFPSLNSIGLWRLSLNKHLATTFVIWLRGFALALSYMIKQMAACSVIDITCFHMLERKLRCSRYSNLYRGHHIIFGHVAKKDTSLDSDYLLSLRHHHMISHIEVSSMKIKYVKDALHVLIAKMNPHYKHLEFVRIIRYNKLAILARTTTSTCQTHVFIFHHFMIAQLQQHYNKNISHIFKTQQLHKNKLYIYIYI
ncbi:hypothetical protein ACJX0J_022188, partial [Zea mays]